MALDITTTQHTPLFNWSEHSRVSGTYSGLEKISLFIVCYFHQLVTLVTLVSLWCVASDSCLSTGQASQPHMLTTCCSPGQNFIMLSSHLTAHSSDCSSRGLTQAAPTYAGTLNLTRSRTIDKQAGRLC